MPTILVVEDDPIIRTTVEYALKLSLGHVNALTLLRISQFYDRPSLYKSVMDFIVHPRDRMMVIGTHGRGVWTIDVSRIGGR